MRLTLRTLLAYLDGILEPNDAQDLGKKIEESDYATSLVHRIRDVIRRLRLGAPSLTDRNPLLDPNTVAEYLDNTLDSEGVTNFEKVCLDSDSYLAEVASCHQVLTLVLGEPAEIDPACRQRMYNLKDSPESNLPPPTPALGATTIVAGVGTSPTLDLGQDEEMRSDRKPRPKPTVPEYLRDSRKPGRWLPMAATAIVVFFFLVALLTALGQFDAGTPLGNVLTSCGLIREKKEVKEVAVAPSVKEPVAEEGKEISPVVKDEVPKTESGAKTEKVEAVPKVEKKEEPKVEPVPMGTHDVSVKSPTDESTMPVAPEPPKGTPKVEPSEKTPVAPPPGVAGEKATVPEVKPEPAKAVEGAKPSPQEPGKMPPASTDGKPLNSLADKTKQPETSVLQKGPATPETSPVVPKTVLEPDVAKKPEGDGQGNVAPGPAPEPLGRLASSDQVVLERSERRLDARCA
jgi:hypothetical protein